MKRTQSAGELRRGDDDRLLRDDHVEQHRMHLCIWIGAAIANNDQPLIQIDGLLNGRQLWQRSGFKAKPTATPDLRP